MILTVGLALGACSTGYQDLQGGGLFDGITTERVTSNTFHIVARGNASTNPDTVHDYMMFKAAETTQYAGGTHFVVIVGPESGTAPTTTAALPSQTRLRPDSYFRILTLEPGASPPDGAFSADDVIHVVGARVRPRRELAEH